MATKAKVTIEITGVPTLGDKIELQLNSLTPILSEEAANARLGVNYFDANSVSLQTLAENLKTAFYIDYENPASVAAYNVTVSFVPGTVFLTIECNDYNSNIWSIITNPSWATITITPEVQPAAFQISNISVSEADSLDPSLNVRFLASVINGIAPYNITSPLIKSAPTAADLFFDYLRFPTTPAILIINDNVTSTNASLPRVDIWRIDSVSNDGNNPAIVTINASKQNVGDVNTTITYSIDGVNYQVSNVFNGVSSDGIAYIKDNLGGVWSQSFTIPPEINSSIGYYRYKLSATENKTITFLKNGISSGTALIEVIPSCPDSKTIKFLDKNGQYRFWTFNKFFEINDSPKKIGSVNKFIVDISTDQSTTSNIGYTNERQIKLTSSITRDQLIVNSDIYTSPRVYLHIGSNNSDTIYDWLEVELTALNNIVKPSKSNVLKFDFILTLPKHYTITML